MGVRVGEGFRSIVNRNGKKIVRSLVGVRERGYIGYCS